VAEVPDVVAEGESELDRDERDDKRARDLVQAWVGVGRIGQLVPGGQGLTEALSGKRTLDCGVQLYIVLYMIYVCCYKDQDLMVFGCQEILRIQPPVLRMRHNLHQKVKGRVYRVAAKP